MKHEDIDSGAYDGSEPGGLPIGASSASYRVAPVHNSPVDAVTIMFFIGSETVPVVGGSPHRGDNRGFGSDADISNSRMVIHWDLLSGSVTVLIAPSSNTVGAVESALPISDVEKDGYNFVALNSTEGGDIRLDYDVINPLQRKVRFIGWLTPSIDGHFTFSFNVDKVEIIAEHNYFPSHEIYLRKDGEVVSSKTYEETHVTGLYNLFGSPNYRFCSGVGC